MTWHDDVAISPFHLLSGFSGEPSFDQKIEIFAAQTLGWQLNIAERCSEEITDSGFAVLAIVFSYFEMIARFRVGNLGTSNPGKYFRDGALFVFPEIGEHLAKKEILDTLYEQVRCVLYHARLTGRGVTISNQYPEALGSSADGMRLDINYQKLVKALKLHFFDYLRQLRDPANVELRHSFEQRFDQGMQVKMALAGR